MRFGSRNRWPDVPSCRRKTEEPSIALSRREGVLRRARHAGYRRDARLDRRAGLLPILELGLDWYSGWTGIVVYPGDFRVRRAELDEHGVMHEWDDELAGEAMPGGPVVLSWDAAANDPYINVVITSSPTSSTC